MSNGATATKEQESPSSAAFGRMLAQLRGNPMVALLIAGAASIAIVAALLMWASSPDYRVLFSNLSEADGGRIISELDTRGVPYQFSEGGQALLVPSDQVHQLRLQLAEQGLPEGGNVGFEIMDNQAFGVSEFAEQVNFQRGLEGELSSSIESLGPVARARVHLSMAKPSVFVREREPAKASVILTLHGGRTLGEGQVNAVVHMVSSSVPELAAANVTVVDQNGRLLSLPDGNGRDLDGSQLDYIAEVERSYRQRIETLLMPILGSDNVRAQVSAQIDFSRREETAERYGPNQPPNESAVRSRQSSFSYNGNDDLASGIPGALSNTPPGVAASPIELPEGAQDGDEEDADANDDADEAQQNAQQATNRLNRDDVVNYEVDRSVSHVEYQRGQVERLSTAVVVNFRGQQDEDGEWQRVALSPEELNQIERLVRQAMGFSEARGDQLEVVNTPFTERDADERDLEWWQDPDIQQLAFTLGRYLLVGLAILLLYLLILRPLIKRHTQAPAAPAALPAGFQARVGEPDDPAEDDEASDETTYDKPQRRHKSSAYEQNLSDLREMAQEDPRMVGLIVRSWMNKE
ncbi:MAG TPA: flagellar basal-body MS-ring/collar protein FliF [Halomonas sp.]|nr:flagellar basal-body MS-ring/collar protein FliF [Halomonas sp.]